jgi:hypothetical protein
MRDKMLLTHPKSRPNVALNLLYGDRDSSKVTFHATIPERRSVRTVSVKVIEHPTIPDLKRVKFEVTRIKLNPGRTRKVRVNGGYGFLDSQGNGHGESINEKDLNILDTRERLEKFVNRYFNHRSALIRAFRAF